MDIAAGPKSISIEKISRKGAKPQSAIAVLRAFLCAFAPLCEKYFSPPERLILILISSPVTD